MLRYAAIVPFVTPEDGPEMPLLPLPFDKYEVLQAEGSVYPPAPENECIVLVGREAYEAAFLAIAADGGDLTALWPVEKEMRDARPALEAVVTVLGEVDW